MTNDEIRKLLGGYATNNLTETERQALFEAALEDQELFDALQQEQGLKEMLADPVSRAQVRQALVRPSAARPRWWAWTAAASAVAGLVVVVAVIRWTTIEPPQPSVALKAPTPVIEQPVEKRESDAKAAPQPARTRAAAAKQAVPRPSNEHFDAIQITPTPPRPAPTRPPPPALTASQQVQVEAQVPSPSAVPSQGRSSDTQAQSQQVVVGGAINSLRDQAQSQASPAQIKAALAGARFKSNSPAVRYALLKRDADGNYQPLQAGAILKAGDAVRLSVVPITSGYLSLSRKDASGEWKRVFPETGPGLAIEANGNYTIPASPIEVSDTDQNFRLTLAPTSMNASDKVKTRTLQLKKELPAIMQSTVDLIIGPRKVP